MTRIYSDDPLVHYRNSTVPPEQTRYEIEALLQEYGIARESISWQWNTPFNITLSFHVRENFNGQWHVVTVTVECPEIWDRYTRPNKPDQLNWLVSMRMLHWYIKSHLETAYARQASLIHAFMENVELPDKRKLRDVAFPMLEGHGPLRTVNIEKDVMPKQPLKTVEKQVKDMTWKERMLQKPSYLKERRENE